MRIIRRIINSSVLWGAWLVIPFLMEFIPAIRSLFILKKRRHNFYKRPKIQYCPDITIIIPVYNSKDTLFQCIESIQNSTYPNEHMKILLIDNKGSHEDFQVYAKAQEAFPNLNMHWMESKQGKSKALNMALYNAEGKYIMNVDSDGFFDKNAIMNMIEKFEQDPIEKNQVIEKLNNEMIKNKIYDTVTHTWSEEYLRKYVHQLCEKQVRKFSFVKIQCLTNEAIETLLLHANYVLGNNTITFKIKDNEYIFLFINADMTDVRNEMDYIIPQNTKNLLSFTCDGYWDKEEDIIKNLQLGDKANG